MPFIEITRATFLSSQPAAVGDVFEVDEQTAKATVQANKAKIVDAPASAVAEPPKPNVTKVSKAKDKSSE